MVFVGFVLKLNVGSGSFYEPTIVVVIMISGGNDDFSGRKNFNGEDD